ncbi:NPCBM/NEW2 domain-containing protein [Streptomyces sp. NPDC058701]|uniref:NPCBM/NEW2 domain-containing protein n=1 Tax=Streptomyces sp. NPDC058701 TaxID=3346608 RepID=UPI0036514C5A
MTIGGTTFTKGLGVHAVSELTYFLAGRCTTLTARVGVDDEASNAAASVVFQVLRDGTKVTDSGTLTAADAARTLTTDLTGAREITLAVTDAGNGNAYNHADWAEPVITCSCATRRGGCPVRRRSGP